MKKNKEKRVRKPLKDLTLLDRFLFDTAMSVPEIYHNMLSIILDDPHLPKIHYSIAEKTQEPFYDSRAVRLDLLMKMMLSMMRKLKRRIPAEGI